MIIAAVALLALGVMVGGIVSAAVSGDPRDTLVWAVAMSAVVLLLIVVVFRAVRGWRPSPKVPTPARWVLASLLAILGAAAVLVPAIAGGAFADSDYLTGAGQQHAMDEVAKVVGNHDAVDVDFYDGYILVTAPTHPGADTCDLYQYRYGRAERLEPEMIPGDTRTSLFDGSAVDYSLVPKLVKDAERRAKDTSPTSLHVSLMQPLDAKEGQPPRFEVEVDSAYKGVQIEYSVTGEWISTLKS